MKTANGFGIDFLVPGFSKCGTTTLCALLSQHPAIFIPPGEGKEPLYFIREESEARKAAYRDLFEHATPLQLLGEGSTFYSAHQHDREARDRIHAHNPEMKFIWIARDPIDRIESSYREFHHSGHLYGIDVPPVLAQALVSIPALLHDSSFWARLATYRGRFPDSQMLVVFLEDLHADPRAVLQRCYGFLGVDPAFSGTLAELRMNPRESKLRDSALMRRLRRVEAVNKLLSRAAPAACDQLLLRFGLRRRFDGPVEWDEAALAALQPALVEDALMFLRHAGRDPALWPRLARLASRSP